MYKYYLFLTLALYSAAYGFYLVISHGLGNKAVFLQMRRYLPCALAAVFPIALTRQSISSPFFLLTLAIAFMWIVTYPTLYYLSNYKVSPDFEFHFESVFGYYFISWADSLLILSHSLSTVIAPLIVTILSIIEIIIFIIPLAQISYYLLYRSCINENGMQMLQETNYNEIIEFFRALPAYFNIILLLLLGSSTWFFAEINFSYLNSAVTLTRRQIGLLSVAALFLTHYLWKPGHGVFVRTAIIKFYLEVKEYRSINKRYSENIKMRMDSLQAEALKKASVKPASIVLVIGESASKDYMQAFNTHYPYATTPWLSGLAKSPNCILFPHAYSTCANTVLALSRALTEFNQYNGKNFYESCSIVDIAHKLGYKVHWYSNQGHLGAADTPVSLIAETADVAKWTKQKINQVQFDESLLTYLDELDPGENNFLIIHLKGSHFNFLNRYPKEFTKFGVPGKYDLELNYANSIAYTDYVLSKIFAFAQEKLNMQSFIYFSDHATMPDKRRSPNFQGFASVRIPLAVYFADEYIKQNPDVYNSLLNNKDKYWTNDLAYELICNIFNISSNHYDENNSLASPKYKYTKETLRTNLGKTSLAEDNSEK